MMAMTITGRGASDRLWSAEGGWLVIVGWRRESQRREEEFALAGPEQRSQDEGGAKDDGEECEGQETQVFAAVHGRLLEGLDGLSARPRLPVMGGILPEGAL